MFKYQLLYFWQSRKPRSDWFRINGCDVISEVSLQRLEDKAIQEALTINLAPLPGKRYVDDSHTRFEAVHQSHGFLNILNKEKKAIQYTLEKEDQSQKRYHYKHWHREISV